MKSSTTVRVATIVGLAVGAFALSAFAQTWTGAPANPPSNNTPAPVNVGSALQTKLGTLGVASLITANFTMGGGGPKTGYILTSSDNAGDAVWQAPGTAPTCTNTSISSVQGAGTASYSGTNSTNDDLLVVAADTAPSATSYSIGATVNSQTVAINQGGSSQLSVFGITGGASISFIVPPGANYMIGSANAPSGGSIVGTAWDLCK